MPLPTSFTTPLARAAAALSPRQHAALAIGAAVLIALSVIFSVQLWGDARAVGPRSVATIAGQSDRAAPRVQFADAAVAADPEALGGGDGFADQGVSLPSAGLAATSATTPFPPTLDPLPDTVAPLSRRAALVKAPIAALHARSPHGLLPVVAADGRTVGRDYARPFPAENRQPKVALVVGGLGFNARTTAAAIDELPPEVTLSFAPFTEGLQGWIDRARAAGHEVLIETPMQSWDPRGTDTGPQTLTVDATAQDNITRLESILGRATGYFGVMNYLGQRFVASREAAAPIVAALDARGLVMVGNGVGLRSAFGLEAARAGLTFSPADRVIDADRDAEDISEQLLALETQAQRSGAALGVGFAFPVTIEQIKVWARNLETRGFALAPASAVIAARTAR